MSTISKDLGAVTAYAIAVEKGYTGTEEEWLASLKGDGGESAYQIAVRHGYSGTEQEWIDSLHNEDSVARAEAEQNAGDIAALASFEATNEILYTKDSEISGNFRHAYDETYVYLGYINANGTFAASGSYHSHYYLVHSDGEIYIETAGNSGLVLAHFTGAPGASTFNERYRLSDHDLPDAGNPLAVSAGDVIVISLTFSNSSYNFTLHTGLFEGYEPSFTEEAMSDIGDKLLDSSSFMNSIASGLDADRKVHIVKGAYRITISSGKAKYVFERKQDGSIAQNIWMWTQCYAGGGSIPLWISGNDSEGPMKQRGTSYIGGLHGYEMGKDSYPVFLCDGVSYTYSTLPDTVDCMQLSIFVTSDLYYYGDSSNKAFLRNKRLDFVCGKVTVTNRWKYIGTRDSTFDVEVWYGGGLFPVHLAGCTFNGYSPNSDPVIYNEAAYSQNDTDFTEAHMYGEGFTVRIKCLKYYENYWKGGNVKYTAGVEHKVYFGAINTNSSNAYIMNNGDVITGAFEVEIY